ncbi:class I SAM-dependent DNA methyltransferase [Mesorhizobium sp. L-2-11]|uniref:class I SAM-dependent DNA methyltransferase n=1 Tax=Mesorhizobium sp. L-2-11 TaxID=2744521 RepID=UPI0019280A3F|nr:class I SAM-dependent methyltransferase [Mesorhizobium sp. L-2-11]
MLDEYGYDDNLSSMYEEYTNLIGRDTEAGEAAAFLERFCIRGNALELGIGNGRVAGPLSERGVRVEGIDNSDSMLKLLAERTYQVEAWKGDIANFSVEQVYDLVFCIYGTFTLLSNREDQIACLRSAAAALNKEGVLVIEIRVPVLGGFVNRQRITARLFDDKNTFVDTETHDPLNQTVTSTSLWFSGKSIRRWPQRIRYVYHQELDTMAECVGLELAERWENWMRDGFTDTSERHISVYRRASP